MTDILGLVEQLKGRADMARATHPVDAEIDDKAAAALTQLDERVKELERETARWKHTADEQSANVTFLREKERQAKSYLDRECADVDDLMRELGLRNDEWRTDGGFLNVPRVVTKISEMRVDAAIAERIDAAIKRKGQ